MTLCNRRLRPHNGLLDLESFELRMFEIERTRGFVTGARVGYSERFRFRPPFEGGLALPDSVRGIERVVLGLGPLEQMKFHEARNLLQLRVSIEPDALEGIFGAPLHAETIHRDELHVSLLVTTV